MKTRTWLKLAAVATGGYFVAKRLAPPSYSFTDKVAIVTGGSRGLGLELARRLVESGAKVAICAQNEAELEVAQRELEGRGAEVFSGPCDVGDREQVTGFVNAVLGRFGRVDVLINNAGVISVSPIEHVTDADYEASMRVHLDGPRFFCEAVLPHMRNRRSGRIVNISSIGGRIVLPHLLPYCVGKFALVGYSEALGAEVAKDGIRVTTVCPGLMRTGSPMNVPYKGQAEKEFAWFATSDVTPVVSIASREAAERILDACARGRREFVFPFTAKVAVLGHDVFRELSLATLGVIGRLMPSPGGCGTDAKLGYEAESKLVPKAAREELHEAATRNNE